MMALATSVKEYRQLQQVFQRGHGVVVFPFQSRPIALREFLGYLLSGSPALAYLVFVFLAQSRRHIHAYVPTFQQVRLVTILVALARISRVFRKHCCLYLMGFFYWL